DGPDSNLHGDPGPADPVPADARHNKGADVNDSANHIDLRDLSIRYGDVAAVNGISFKVGRGEHVTLLGPSGCGKTTTLRAIAGLRSEEHTSELQSLTNLVCRLL